MSTYRTLAMFSFLILTFPLSLIAAEGGLRTITVRGEHTVEVAPDYVDMEFSIFEQRNTAERAKAQVDERVIAVLTALSELPIPDADISMGGISVAPVFEYDRNENEELNGYLVTRTITITLRDFELYEPLAAKLVDAGVGELESLQSGVDDENQYKHAALEAAARDAKVRAEAIAAGLGVSLGLPVEVGENRLRPLANFQQRVNNYGNIEEVVVTGSFIRNRQLPPLFVPENIEVEGTVWVVFELLSN
ncbi:MAG: SIMPL domain-containing protein [Gammaproteobacteria bacterium]|nr:SIMPL domain-containing protein [Planctomycetaceae bacterium]MCB1671854.1 SIMPL domain-containing protein [Pseudomonadales bacterium]MCP5346234.1 SIMPL domain-containing protein [Pseudomonadales bacterium]